MLWLHIVTVGGFLSILECFNNPTFLSVVYVSWQIKSVLDRLHVSAFFYKAIFRSGKGDQ